MKLIPDSLSFKTKDVFINGEKSVLAIDSGTNRYSKEFKALPGQQILAGDYVEWADETWLVYLADVDNELYIDGDLRLCNFKLYWQNDSGEFISRWAWVQNASAYNNGEEGNKTLTLKSNQFMVYLPYDEDTMVLDNGKRIHMANYDGACRPYELTRPDDITYRYGKKGVMQIIFTQDQIRTEKDRLVQHPTEDKMVWICDYMEVESPVVGSEIHSAILGRSDIRVGQKRTHSVVFYDDEENVVPAESVDFEWKIISNFTDDIVVEKTAPNKIGITLNKDGYVDQKMCLQVIINDEVNSEMEITVQSEW